MQLPAWNAMQVDAQADFERIDEAHYTWGDDEIRIEADTGVDGDFVVLFSNSERELLDPDQPME